MGRRDRIVMFPANRVVIAETRRHGGIEWVPSDVTNDSDVRTCGYNAAKRDNARIVQVFAR